MSSSQFGGKEAAGSDRMIGALRGGEIPGSRDGPVPSAARGALDEKGVAMLVEGLGCGVCVLGVKFDTGARGGIRGGPAARVLCCGRFGAEVESGGLQAGVLACVAMGVGFETAETGGARLGL